MSLSPFDSFQSRFVTYLLNFPRITTTLCVRAVSPRFYIFQQIVDTQETSCQPYASKGQLNIIFSLFPSTCNYNMAVARVLHLILRP